jgi:hypothetical protein
MMPTAPSICPTALIISQFIAANLAMTQPSSRSKDAQSKIEDATGNAVAVMEGFDSSLIAMPRAVRAEPASDPGQALAIAVPDEGYRKTFLKLARNLAPTGKSFSELEIKSAIRPQLDGIIFAPPARKAIDESIKKSAPPAAPDSGEDVTFTGILRAVHLDQDWLEVTVNDPDERHIRVDNAGEAIDDVVGPMVNREVKVNARLLPTGKFTFEDIEPIE